MMTSPSASTVSLSPPSCSLSFPPPSPLSTLPFSSAISVLSILIMFCISFLSLQSIQDSLRCLSTPTIWITITLILFLFVCDETRLWSPDLKIFKKCVCFKLQGKVNKQWLATNIQFCVTRQWLSCSDHWMCDKLYMIIHDYLINLDMGSEYMYSLNFQYFIHKIASIKHANLFWFLEIWELVWKWFISVCMTHTQPCNACYVAINVTSHHNHTHTG